MLLLVLVLMVLALVLMVVVFGMMVVGSHAKDTRFLPRKGGRLLSHVTARLVGTFSASSFF